MWLDNCISVDVDLIIVITGFPKEGVDPTMFFTRKEQDVCLVAWMKEKYDIVKYTRGFYISSINDQGVRLVAKVFSSKILQNIPPK